MLYVICLRSLHYALPSLFCIGKFVIYFSFFWVILTMRHCNVCFCIDMCVYFVQSNWWLYLILGIGLFYHVTIITLAVAFICLWILYPCLLKYVGVIYTIYSLVVFNIGKIVIYISCIWFVMSLLSSSLPCMHISGLTSPCFD